MMPTIGGEAEFEIALDRFREVMAAKFRLRAERHPDRSITVKGSEHLHEDGVYERLWAHLEAEMQEMRDADHTQDEIGEAVDVANCAFLIWWRDGGAS